jgi:hypothetical protein
VRELTKLGHRVQLMLGDNPLSEFRYPMVGRGPGLHADKATRQRFEELQHWLRRSSFRTTIFPLALIP